MCEYEEDRCNNEDARTRGSQGLNIWRQSSKATDTRELKKSAVSLTLTVVWVSVMICDRRKAARLKGKVYRMVVRPAATCVFGVKVRDVQRRGKQHIVQRILSMQLNGRRTRRRPHGYSEEGHAEGRCHSGGCLWWLDSEIEVNYHLLWSLQRAVRRRRWSYAGPCCNTSVHHLP